MRLQHLHLPRPVPYTLAGRVQDHVVRQHIDAGLLQQRAATGSSAAKAGAVTAANAAVAASPPPPTPPPFLLTFQTRPTYTCGRREIPLIGEERIAHLRAGGRADFEVALRGGQTTFHGPGQLTAYLVATLRAHALSPRCYVRFLEQSVIRLCGQYGVPAATTADPGVWVDPDTKVCAVGVHMRRGVTSHGLGLNINPDLAWFHRIVACGLEGKRVTSLEEQGVAELTVAEAAVALADIMSKDLQDVDGVEQLNGVDGVDLSLDIYEPAEYPPPPPEEAGTYNAQRGA